MTEVAFHFNAPDRLGYACRLLRKAVGRGARVVVTGNLVTLERLDTQLWVFEPGDFIAHCRIGPEAPDPRVLRASPVVLADDLGRDLPHRHLLVNLGEDVPPRFEEFERVFEIVSHDEAERQGARARWRAYAQRGVTIVRHDLATEA